MIVAGLDLSLTDTGIALLDADGIRTQRVRSTGKKTDTVVDTARRIDKLEAEILAAIGSQPDFVVVEAPAFASKGGKEHERGGLWWTVVRELVRRHVPVATASPNTLKKYATGKGVGDKDVVLAAVVRRYAEIEVTNNNVADAVVLLAMGLRHLGLPIDDPMPQANLAAMGGASWPS